MIDSGFRPYPGDEIVAKWEEVGGQWQVLRPNGEMLVLQRIRSYHIDWILRPIHPAHGWNHYPWMWQVLTGEDMTPKTTGPHWWGLREQDAKWIIVETNLERVWSIGTVLTFDTACSIGKWGGPAEGMPGEVGR